MKRSAVPDVDYLEFIENNEFEEFKKEVMSNYKKIPLMTYDFVQMIQENRKDFWEWSVNNLNYSKVNIYKSQHKSLIALAINLNREWAIDTLLSNFSDYDSTAIMTVLLNTKNKISDPLFIKIFGMINLEMLTPNYLKNIIENNTFNDKTALILKDKRIVTIGIKNDIPELIPNTLKKIFLKKDKK